MSLGNLQYPQLYQQRQQQQHPLLAAISGNNYDGGPTDADVQRVYHSMANWQRPFHTHSYFQQYPAMGSKQRPLNEAASDSHSVYYDDSGDGGGTGRDSSGYGYESPSSGGSGAEYHSGSTGYASHPPHDGGYTYHHHSSSNYEAPPPPQPPPVHVHSSGSGGKKSKKKGSSVMSALTLLAFFFFVNLLQSCLKEQMDVMNPTVMVLPTGGARNRFNKLAEMNSREQQQHQQASNSIGSSSSGSLASVSPSSLAPLLPEANIVLQPGTVVVVTHQTPSSSPYPLLNTAAGESTAVVTPAQPSLMNVYGGSGVNSILNKPNEEMGSHYTHPQQQSQNHRQPQQQQHQHQAYSPPTTFTGIVDDDPLPEYYDDTNRYSYPNQTVLVGYRPRPRPQSSSSSSSSYHNPHQQEQQQYGYKQHHYNYPHYQQSAHPHRHQQSHPSKHYSIDSAYPSPALSSFSTAHRQRPPWSISTAGKSSSSSPYNDYDDIRIEDVNDDDVDDDDVIGDNDRRHYTHKFVTRNMN